MFDWIPNAPPIGNLWKCMEFVTADTYQERRMTFFLWQMYPNYFHGKVL